MKLSRTAISLSLALALAACSETETAASHLAQAKQYLTQDKIQEGVIELKNAIKLEPNNNEVRFVLGRVYLDAGDGVNAVKELEKARSLKYPDDKLIPLLARAYLISNADVELLDLEKSVSTLSNDSKVRYYAYATLAHVRANEAGKAKDAAEKSNNAQATSPFATLAKAYVLLSENEIDKADVMVEKALGIDADNPELVMLDAQIATIQKDYQQAADQYKKYLKLQPKSRVTYLMLADALIKTEGYQEAEQYVDAILANVPNQPLANYIKSVIKFAEKDYKAASEFSEKAIQAGNSMPHAKLVAGSSAFHQGNYEQANYHLEPIVQYLKADHAARKMFAVSQYQLGRVENIAENLAGYQPSTEEDAAFLSSLSVNLFKIGAKEEAKKIAEQSALSEQSTAKHTARQGIMKLMMNDPTAVSDLESALKEQPDLIGAELAIAYASLEEGDYDKAMLIAEKWIAEHPEKAGGYNMLGAIAMRKREFEQAEKHLLVGLDKEPNNLFGMTEMSRVLVRLDRKADAAQYAQQAVAQYPDSIKALRYQFAVTKDQKGLKDIEKAYNKAPEELNFIILYAEALMDLGNYADALIVANKVENNVNTPKQIWRIRLTALNKLKNIDQAQAVVDDWMQSNPYHPEPILLKVEFLVKEKEAQRALSLLDRALTGHHEDNMFMQSVKLQILLDAHRVTEARKLYAQIKDKITNESTKAGVEGRIAIIDERYEDAIPLMSQFYDSFPSTQNALYLSLAYNNHGDSENAIASLEKHLKTFDRDDRVRTALANLYLKSDKSKAYSKYERLIESQPNNVLALNNLAWLAMEKGELETAIGYIERAYSLAPTLPNVPDTFGQILLKLDKKRESLAKAKEAYELAKGRDVDISLNYAQVLVANKRKNKARELLDSIIVKNTEQQAKLTELKEQL